MTSKKLTSEEAVHFVKAFASAFFAGAVPAFKVNVTKFRNRFFFRVLTKDGRSYSLKPVVSNYVLDEIGTFGGVDTLFQKAHPRMMLRDQTVTFDELVDLFKLDKEELARVIVKRLKRTVASALNSWNNPSKMSFRLSESWESWEERHKNGFYSDEDAEGNSPTTSEVSSIEELIVWADLNNGVS